MSARPLKMFKRSNKKGSGYTGVKRGWRTIDGKKVYFRSRMEANYARYLTYLGIVWEFEPTTFWFEGIKRGVVSYTPDFYLPDEEKYFELKGYMDAKSKTKIKRMTKYYPKVSLEVIDWKTYKMIEKALGKVIPAWES